MNLQTIESKIEQSPLGTWLLPKLSGKVNISQTERLVSKVAGGVLMLNAVVRPRIGSLVGLLLGGALLQRGMSGHCPVYDKLGKSTATGADSTPSQFSKGTASESTMSARSLAGSDTSSAHGVGSKIGIGSTSDAETTTGATSPLASTQASNKTPPKPRVHN